MKLCFGLFSKVLILFCFCLLYVLSENEFDNTINRRRKCYHKRNNHDKHFYSGNTKRVESFNKFDIKFEKLRIHFDYTHTLKYEEKIIKELIIPSVKKLLENTLKIRRFPGKIRFPREECEGIPIPPYLKSEGVDSDLIILIATNRGLNKLKNEKILIKNKPGDKNESKIVSIKNSSIIGDFKHRMKSHSNTYLEGNFNNTEENKIIKLELGYLNTDNNSSNLTQNSAENLKNKSQTLLPDSSEEINNVLGMSYMCVQDTYTLRPIAGVMQYGADFELTSKSIEEAIWTTLHEITHILVMDYDLYSDFIDSEFNRLGYERTIKIKTRLKYLDIILKERHDLMNDYFAFGRFERSKNNSNSTEEYKVKKKLFSKNEFEEIFSNSNIESNNNNDDKAVYVDGKAHSDKFRTGSTALKNKEKRNLKKEESYIKKNAKIIVDSSIISINETNTSDIDKNITKNICLNNCTDDVKISSKNSNKENTQNISPRKNNSDNYHNSNFSIDNIFNTGNYEVPSIKLPVFEEYYEIKITPGFNITTLAMYIDNFTENTKIFIITPKVLDMAKKHFGCDNMEGVELEHFGGLGSAYSHWSKRVLNTDYLIADTYGEYYVSNISLALFEDSGWYKVDYTKSDKLLWGRSKGCDFLNQKCIVKKETFNPFILSEKFQSKNRTASVGKNSITYESNFKDEFCTNINDEICSIGNIFRATCGLKVHEHSKVPKQYNYFGNPRIFAMTIFGDFCPYPVEWMDESSNPLGSCKNGKHIRKDLGENVCSNCRCFRSSLVEERIYEKNKGVETNTNDTFNRYTDIRAACYETRCRENSNGKSELVVTVNDYEIICPRGGGLLSIEGYNGFIKCPKSEIICDGIIDTKAQLSNTSSYILSADLSNKVLKFYNDYFNISFNK